MKNNFSDSGLLVNPNIQHFISGIAAFVFFRAVFAPSSLIYPEGRTRYTLSAR